MYDAYYLEIVHGHVATNLPSPIAALHTNEELSTIASLVELVVERDQSECVVQYCAIRYSNLQSNISVNCCAIV